MSKEKGFTFTELVLCLAVISILLGIGIPSTLHWRARLQLRAETLEVVGLLQLAKSEAAKRNSFVVVALEDNELTVFVDNGKGGAKLPDWHKQPDEQELAFKTFPSGITLTSTFKNNNKARFSGYSGISAGSFILTDRRGNTMKVILNIVGRIRVSRN